MKNYLLFFTVAFASCGSSAERKLSDADRPPQAELTATKHVKPRNGRENKKRAEYYNSLQYKAAYKQY